LKKKLRNRKIKFDAGEIVFMIGKYKRYCKYETQEACLQMGHRATFLFISFILIFGSCDHLAQTNLKIDKSAKDTAILSSDTAVNNQSIEIIYPDSISINGKIPFETTEQNLLKCFGAPDSILTITDKCGTHFDGRVFSEYYFGLTTFQVYQGQALLKNINFLDHRFRLVSPAMTFDNSISLEVFKNAFPNAYTHCRDFKDIEKNIMVKLIEINTNQKCDDQWLFEFEKGKLVNIEYKILC
jgi:hypothetical protein